MPDEVCLQHWLERRKLDQDIEKKEIANMDKADYITLLEELEHK